MSAQGSVRSSAQTPRRQVVCRGSVRRVAHVLLTLGIMPLARLPAQARRTTTSTTVTQAQAVLAPLVEAYGPSGREDSVRALVLRLLPSWAAPTTDTAGNVWVRVGTGPLRAVFVAHMDEIGFEVTDIRTDGQLVLRALGGFMPSLFEAEPALIHTRRGPVPAVFTLRDSVGANPRRTPAVREGRVTTLLFRVDPGTANRIQTESLGVAVGDVVTMPKAYVRLAGTRATGRSFDDRVGCAAQLLALRRLVPARVRGSVLFVFSTREEVGLVGARAVAAALATETRYRVYALDTFVSADAPLEVKTFADAPLGAGAVARAVDNSSVTPVALRDSLVTLARAARIPLQVGTTNGGNDGSVFARYGVPDIPIGWPLRYSHSPAEVIDLRDLAAMADLVTAIVERW
jgi:putative aminopeptidase